jgi:hypothetical protein
MQRKLMTPYSPQQNDMVEHRNQIVVGLAHSLHKSKNLLGWLWGEAMAMAVYLLNQSPMKSVINKMPFEA